MQEKKQLLKIKDKRLESFLIRYCRKHNANLGAIIKMLRRMAVSLPTELQKFDGKNTFFTSTGEKITINDGIKGVQNSITVTRGEQIERYEKPFY